MTPGSERLVDALDQWLSESVGSEEERRVADALLAVVGASQKLVDLSRPYWPSETWSGVRDREMRDLNGALLDLLDAVGK